MKFHETDPLICPKCAGSMKIIAFIEREDLIRKILKHVGLWEVKCRPPPKAHSPPGDFNTGYSDSQISPRMMTRPQYHTPYIVSPIC